MTSAEVSYPYKTYSSILCMLFCVLIASLVCFGVSFCVPSSLASRFSIRLHIIIFRKNEIVQKAALKDQPIKNFARAFYKEERQF